jgi:uncharacterized membrane protein
MAKGGRMAFCPNCGAAVDGKFCSACGKPVGNPSIAGAGSAAAGLQDNAAGALTYLLGVITGILFLVLEPYNRNREVRFHAFQSIFFTAGVILIYIALSIVGSAMAAVVPLIGAMLIGLLYLLVWIGSVVLWLYLMIKTYSGTKVVLPVVGPLAEKQAG